MKFAKLDKKFTSIETVNNVDQVHDEGEDAVLENHFLEFLKYTLVAFVALVFDYLTLISLTELFAFHYLLSATVGFLIGLIVNYILATRFVFKNRKLSDKRAEFTVFAIIGAGGLLLNNGIMWGMTDILLVDYKFSKIIAAGIAFFWNFYVRRFILFKV